MSDFDTRSDRGLDPNILDAITSLIGRKIDQLETKLPSADALNAAVEKAVEKAAENVEKAAATAELNDEIAKINLEGVMMEEVFRAKYGITISPKEKKVKVRNRDHYYDEYAPTHTDLCK